MYFMPGHLAVSILAGKAAKCHLPVTLAAGFFPDLLDKPLNDLLEITNSGRAFGHSPIGLAALTTVVWLIGGRRWGLSWLIGHAAHIVGDATLIPWFYPFVDYPTSPDINLFTLGGLRAIFNPLELAMETVLLALALMALRPPVFVRKHSAAFGVLCVIAAIATVLTTFLPR